MKNAIPMILIILAVFLGYEGYNRMENTAQIKIGDLKVEAGAKGGKEAAYIFFGLGAVCLVAGLVMLSKRGK